MAAVLSLSFFASSFFYGLVKLFVWRMQDTDLNDKDYIV